MPYEESAWRSLHDVIGAVLAASNPQDRGPEQTAPDTVSEIG